MQAQTAEDKATLFSSSAGCCLVSRIACWAARPTPKTSYRRRSCAGCKTRRAGPSPRAYLSTVVVRLCIDHARAARAQREVYTGPWLPEPLPTAAPDTPGEPADRHPGRVALLRFPGHAGAPQPAGARGVPAARGLRVRATARSPPSSARARPIAARSCTGRGAPGPRRPRFASRASSRGDHRQFLRASLAGDMQGLLSLLSADIVFTGDGGGKALTALKPVRGRTTWRGARWAPCAGCPPASRPRGGIERQPPSSATSMAAPTARCSSTFGAEGVRHVYNVMNPDKLRGLTPRPE